MPRAKLLTVVFGLAVFFPRAEAQRIEDLQGFTQPKETTLTAIRNNPDAFKNVWVTFDIQFGGLSTVYNPFFTRFVPTDYVGLAAWGVEQEIWKLEEFRKDYQFLFVDKRSSAAIPLYKLKKYQRARVVGLVRNTFQGTAWIEITEIRPLPKSLDETTLFHMVRGETFLKEGKWKAARSQLLQASASPNAPGKVKGVIWSDLAQCYLKLGDFPQARKALAMAKQAWPKNPQAAQLAKILEEHPIQGMDNRVEVSSMKDWEKPLWQDLPQEEGSKSSKSSPKKSRTKPVKVILPPGVTSSGKAAPHATPPSGR